MRLKFKKHKKKQIFGGKSKLPCVPIDPRTLICRVNVVDLTPNVVADKEDREFWLAPSERERVLGLLRSKAGTILQPTTPKKRPEKPPKRVLPDQTTPSVDNRTSKVFHSPQVSVWHFFSYCLTLSIIQTDLARPNLGRKGLLL
jgi:hypothetical protein